MSRRRFRAIAFIGVCLFGLVLFFGVRSHVSRRVKPRPTPAIPLVEKPKPETLPLVEKPKPETIPLVEKPKPETLPLVEKPKPETIPLVKKPLPETIPLVEKPKPIPLVEKPLLETVPGYLARRVQAKVSGEVERRRVDYEGERVLFELFREEAFLSPTRALTLSEFLEHMVKEEFERSLRSKAEREKFEGRRAHISGLIPEIEIPKVPLLGESRVNISGENRITFGGRSTAVAGGAQTRRAPSLFPELKMEQALRLNLDGTIGERIKVTIDHNSQRELAATNKVKLRYTGGEDCIVKELELGETQLLIPQTAFTGDVPTRKGLFGVSGKGALGGINLYWIASREQAQSQTREFRGKNPVHVDTFYGNEFAKWRFFLLDTIPVAEILELYLYYDDLRPYGPGKIRCLATVAPETPEDTLPNPDFAGDRRISSFVLLEPNKDYRIHRFLEGNVFLELLRDVREGRLGVSYITAKGETVGGRLYQESLTVIKLLKAHPHHVRSKTWRLMMRNIYALRNRNVQLTQVRIFRDEPDLDRETDENGRTFLYLTGLDPDDDRKVGYPQFVSSLGYLIFPYPEPFARRTLSIPDTIIYRQDLLPPGEGKRYYIVVEYTAASRVIFIGFDVEEETERVYVNGKEQKRGEDYKVDYKKGEITFLKPLPPDAEIRITYEYLPIFMAHARSILGARAEGRFAENGKFGSSIFFRSEMTPQERPRLGSEPFQRMIWQGDLSYTYRNENLSYLLDRLPLLRAKGPTSLSFSGEVATSLPNPNTIGAAYVDDFEDMVLSEDLDLAPMNWHFASVPVGRDTSHFAKKRLVWFLRRVRKDSIFGPRVKEEREEKVNCLKIIFEPDNTASWAGMMTAVGGSVDLRNLENIEGVFRTKSKEGKIYITLATTVEEDAPRRDWEGRIVGYNNFFDSEDRNKNNQLDVPLGEDSGLDTILGEDGKGVTGDDGNDDFDTNTNPQGSEGNRRLDSEDIDGNDFSPRGNNNYYEYEIDLKDTTYITPLANNWRFFRLPLSKWHKKVGTPLDQEIRIVRVWFTSFSAPETIEFYTLGITGSKWRGVKVEGRLPDTLPREVVKVYQVSIENDTSYTSPFPLRRDHTGRREREASLALQFKNLRPQGVVTVPQRLHTKEDWRDYKELKIYVHNDPNLSLLFFIRMGQDSANYYYFRSYIGEGRKVPGTGHWYEFTISLDTLYATRASGSRENYGFQGSPTLAEVRYIALGIENRTDGRVSGSIWFNDIRLVSPYRLAGVGYRTAVSFSLSDLANFSHSLSYLDPNFVRLSEPGGVKTGNYAFNQAYSYSLNLDRLLPASWQFSLPFTYSRNISSLIPKFHPLYPDRRLRLKSKEDTAEVRKSKGGGFSESWGTSIRKGKSGNKLLNYTLEALSFSYHRSKGENYHRLATDTSLRTSSGINYGISPSLSFRIGEKEIYYFPKEVSFGIGYSSSYSARATRASDTAQYRLLRDSTKHASFSFRSAYSPIENLTFDYDEGRGYNLYGIPEGGKRKTFGEEMDRNKSFGISYSFELGEILSPRLDYDGGYSESRMRGRDTIYRRRALENEGELRVETDFNIKDLLAKLKKLGRLSEILQPLDISYSVSRSSEFPTAYSSPPLAYQLGFVDRYREGNVLREPLSRETDNRLSTSSRLNLGDIGVSYSYDYSIEKRTTGGIGNASYSQTWPSLNITLGRIERYLKRWATSSNLSVGFQKISDRSGSLLPTGRLSERGLRAGRRISFSPLIGWQATWKKRINTNLSVNYSFSSNEVNLTGPPQNQKSRTETKDKGFDFSISHAFSAPKGIKLPFLPQIRLTQEMSLSFSIRYSRSESNKIEGGKKTPMGANENISLRLSSSYRISAAVESGLNTGYTSYRDLQRGIRTQSVDLNFWVVFRF